MTIFDFVNGTITEIMQIGQYVRDMDDSDYDVPNIEDLYLSAHGERAE